MRGRLERGVDREGGRGRLEGWWRERECEREVREGGVERERGRGRLEGGGEREGGGGG